MSHMNRIALPKAQPILVIVHPGSLCGSAEMHCGQGRADDIRYAIASEVRNWPNPRIAVITGDLDDELGRPNYKGLALALTRAEFQTYGAPDATGLRIAASQVITHYKLIAGDHVTVTGAWHDQDGTGCVTTIAAELTKHGIQAEISANAPASDADEHASTKAAPSKREQTRR